jgi:hypothetical protein
MKRLAHRFFAPSLCAASSILFAASTFAQDSNPEGISDWFLSG